MKRRKLLTLEKPYWDIQWAFFVSIHSNFIKHFHIQELYLLETLRNGRSQGEEETT